MSVEEMREKIGKIYGGKWKYKVFRMPHNQVIAIYYKFLAEGRFDRHKPSKNPDDDLEQITIWDILNEKEKTNGNVSASDSQKRAS